ncbi:MAG: hypothetical protein KDC34_03420 [Saprospiraceae bacterium]|nr:hypothetical protein [Saprospiraceae bacterium]
MKELSSNRDDFIVYDKDFDITLGQVWPQFTKSDCEEFGACGEIRLPSSVNVCVVGKVYLNGQKLWIEFDIQYADGTTFAEFAKEIVEVPDKDVDAKSYLVTERFSDILYEWFGASRINSMVRTVKILRPGKVDSKWEETEMLITVPTGADSNQENLNIEFASKDSLLQIRINMYMDSLNTYDEDCNLLQRQEVEEVPDLQWIKSYYERDKGYLFFDTEFILKVLRNKDYIERVGECLEGKKDNEINGECWDDYLLEGVSRGEAIINNLKLFSKFINYNGNNIPVDANGNYPLINTNGKRGRAEWESYYLKEIAERKVFLCDEFLKLIEEFLFISPPEDVETFDQKIEWIELQVKSGVIPTQKTLISNEFEMPDQE